jgi:GntR family transcriptional regulator
MRILQIDMTAPTPPYLQLIEQIREAIRAGDLAPRSPLPSVRQMAADLEINANTVAKAYMLLEREGLLTTVRRRGCFVAEDAAGRARRAMGAQVDEALERILAESERAGFSPEALLETLQKKLTERAAQRRSGEANHE